MSRLTTAFIPFLMLLIILLGCQEPKTVPVTEQPKTDTLSVFAVGLSENVVNTRRGAYYLYFTWQKGTLDPSRVWVDIEGQDFVVYNGDEVVYRYTLKREKLFYLRSSRMEFHPPSTYTLRLLLNIGAFGGMIGEDGIQ